jgi:hypothetical protein
MQGEAEYIMEVKINDATDPEGESSYSHLGKGLQFLIQTPLFIIVGVIVMIWETFNRLFQAIYQQGAQLASHPGESRTAETGPVRIKVPMMPIDNYSQLDIDAIIGSLEGLTPAELGVVRDYEISHENRQLILNAIDQRTSGMH